jgi:cellulose biosynthesis protein BcsQ
MITVACYNIKGGVGKTAAAVNLSYLAAGGGASTLVWDLDPQGASSFYFRVKPRVKGGSSKLFKRKGALGNAIKATDYPRLDLLPADFSYRNMDILLEHQRKPGTRLKKAVKPITDEYHFLFLDCAPSISLVSENIFAVADILLVPTIPTTLSLRTLQQVVDFCERGAYRHLEIIPFFSMVDRRKTMHRDIVDNRSGILLNAPRTYIPYASEVEQMGLRRAPLDTYAHPSWAARAYRDMWAELQPRLLERQRTL